MYLLKVGIFKEISAEKPSNHIQVPDPAPPE